MSNVKSGRKMYQLEVASPNKSQKNSAKIKVT